MNVTARRTGKATAADVVVVVVVESLEKMELLLLLWVDKREKMVRADRVERLEDWVCIEWPQQEEGKMLSSVLWRGRWGEGESEVGGCDVGEDGGLLSVLAVSTNRTFRRRERRACRLNISEMR